MRDRLTVAMSTVTGSVHTLKEHSWGASVSPDSKLIAYKDPQQTELWVMGAEGGNARKLITAEPGRIIERIEWSRDGKRLAYITSTANLDKVSLATCDVEGRRNTVVLADRRLKDFIWLPDGRMIYSLYDPPPNEYDANLWEMRVNPSTGKPAGKPVRRTYWAGFSPRELSVSADGKKLAFVNQREQSDILVGRLDAAAHRLEDVRRLTADQRIDWPGGWTRDGKSILFYSDRNGELNLFRQDLDSAEARPILVDAEEKRSPILSPDGSSILYLAWPRTEGSLPAKGRLMKVALSGGSGQPILELNGYPGTAQFARRRTVLSCRGVPDFRCAGRPDGSCVVNQLEGRSYVWLSLNPANGNKREVARLDMTASGAVLSCPSCSVPAPLAGSEAGLDADLEANPAWDLSPGGTRLAIGVRAVKNTRISVLDLSRGSSREIEVKGYLLSYLAWSPDEKGIIAITTSTRGGTILWIDMEGRVWRLYHSGRNFFAPAISPDGRYLAFGHVDWDGNVWLIENL